MVTPNHVAGLVLAAGASSRLGQPKQLVEFEGQPLVARAVEQLNAAGCLSVVTVLGAIAEQIRPVLDRVPTDIVINENWSDGIGNSIAVAIARVHPDASALLIALCDQPLIETDHYRELIKIVVDGMTTIAATQYSDGSSGVPAIFAKAHFPDLANLAGDIGAKKIIARRCHAFVRLSGKHFDLDTLDDLTLLRSSNP